MLTDISGEERKDASKRVLFVGGPASGKVLSVECCRSGIEFGSVSPDFIDFAEQNKVVPLVYTKYKFEIFKVEGRCYHIGRLADDTPTQCFEKIVAGFIQSQSAT